MKKSNIDRTGMKISYSNYRRSKIKIAIIFICILTPAIILMSCATARITRTVEKPKNFPYLKYSDDIPYIKLHTESGSVYSLHSWEFNEATQTITGIGELLDFNRNVIKEDTFSVSYDEILLVETNEINASSPVLGLSVMTGITLAITIACISNPKACFGSCPTFYVKEGNDFVLQAEGFSSSILPSLEEKDIDAISKVKPYKSEMILKLKNEALETHVIRSANILALPHKKNGRIFATTNDGFYEVDKIQKPLLCTNKTDDITNEVSMLDGLEWFSTSDSSNLAEKETVEITFSNIEKANNGLIISYRQKLLTTFLFYQSLSYMGSNTGNWLSNAERVNNDMNQKIGKIDDLLGGIEVLIQSDSEEWIKVGEIIETGPIATDIKIIPLPENALLTSSKIKLRMTKGLWRIDNIALAHIVDTVEPIKITPQKAFYNELEDPVAVKKLNDSTKALVTLPGDEYELVYQLPSNFKEYDYFIESRGYYLEWLRNEWLVDENPDKVNQMLFNPIQYLKDLAPEFKEIEADMERSFWSSKYVLP